MLAVWGANGSVVDDRTVFFFTEDAAKHKKPYGGRGLTVQDGD